MNQTRRYIVDSSVAVKWVLPESSSDQARGLLEAWLRGEIQLQAPDMYVAEITNAIWKRVHIRKDVHEDRGRAALATLLRALPDLVPSASLASQAFELARAFSHPTYDCLYVALALRDQATMVTADRRLLNALGLATGRVIHIDDLELA